MLEHWRHHRSEESHDRTSEIEGEREDEKVEEKGRGRRRGRGSAQVARNLALLPRQW